MSNRTLYIPEHDESVWSEARTVAETDGMSLSQLATEGLKMILHRSVVNAKAATTKTVRVDAAAVETMKKLLKRLGPKRYAVVFAAALSAAITEWQDAKRKRDATLGPQGISNAAKKAAARRLANRQHP